MKIYRIFLPLTAIILLSSCNIKKEKSFAYGNFEATEIMVSAQVQGEILTFSAEEGDKLSAGQIVGLIDTTDLHLKKELLITNKNGVASQLESINASIAVQKQQLENNIKTQKRILNLFNSKAATQKQLDDINGLVELNKKQIRATKVKKQSVLAQIKSIETQIEQIDRNIDKCFIKNPVEGTVLVKYIEKGELAVPGKPLYKVADLSVMKLKAYVSGDQLPEIKIGETVDVVFDKTKSENNIVEGKIIWISSTAEFTPKTIQTKKERVNLVYAVKIAVKNNGSIKIGMPGEFNLK
jgi:HlyD family secretion protein